MSNIQRPKPTVQLEHFAVSVHYIGVIEQSPYIVCGSVVQHEYFLNTQINLEFSTRVGTIAH